MNRPNAANTTRAEPGDQAAASHAGRARRTDGHADGHDDDHGREAR